MLSFQALLVVKVYRQSRVQTALIDIKMVPCQNRERQNRECDQKGDMDSVRQSAEAIRMNMEQRTKIKMIINKYV